MYKVLTVGSYLLTVIGALNWGLIGLFDFNLVNYLLGGFPTIENLVYILVGLAALVSLFTMYYCHKNYKCDICNS